ncbi:MAG TPA: cation diffusion facilitator family transporter [Candidatus Limnocylindrales bacterium]
MASAKTKTANTRAKAKVDKASEESPVAVIGALLANIGIAAAKFIAAFLTGSSAMLAEGIHSLVDTSNEIVLIVGIRRARRPADDLHQFGHGKEIYFWTLVVAVLLFAVGGGLAFYEGLTHLFDPHPIDNVLASYVVLGISFALEAASTFVALRELEPAKSFWRALLDTKDASVLAVLVENVAAMIGLVFAFIGLFLTELTGNPRFDAFGSLAVGIVLMAVAVFLAAESRALLIGESASGELVDQARKAMEAQAGVAAIESLRTMHLGPDHVVVTATVRFDAGRDDVPQIIARLKARLIEVDPMLDDVTIEPASP